MDKVRLLQQKEAENISRLRNKLRNEIMVDQKRTDMSVKLKEKNQRL